MKDKGNMGQWRAKKMRQAKASAKTTRTNGREKLGKRFPTQLQKWMAKKNRSWKHPEYGRWLEAKSG